MSWYLKAIKNYANFSGRARRKEYWMFVLVNFFIGLLIAIVEAIIGMLISANGQSINILTAIYSLFVMIPSLSLSIRRLHDIDKSGWCLLLPLLPVLGWIWFFVYSVKEGTQGENRYGEDPKLA